MKRNQFSGTFSPDQDFVGIISVLLDFSLVLLFQKCSFMHFICLNLELQSLNHSTKAQQRLLNSY